MENNITIRQNQLKFFQQFIESSITNFKSILESIGWTESEIQKKDSLVACTHDKSHRVSVKNLEEHQRNCSLRRLAYTENDVQLSEPVNNSKSSIKIDMVSKQSIFDHEKTYNKEFHGGWKGEDADPKTSDRLLSTFTSDERLALYNFAVKSTEGPEEPPELNLVQSIEDDKELSREERMEQERNAKRRRIKYKSVHTKRKNHTEVIREVISNQMELFKECITHKQKKMETNDLNEDVKTASDTNNENISIQSNVCDDTQSVTSRFSHHSVSSTRSKHRHSSKGYSNDYRERSRHREHSRNHRHEYRHRSSRENYRSHSRSRTTERTENGCHKRTSEDDRHDHRNSRRKINDEYRRDTSNSSNGRDYRRVRKSPSSY